MIIDEELELPKSPSHHLSVIKRSGLLLRLVGFELKIADREKNRTWPVTSVIPQNRQLCHCFPPQDRSRTGQKLLATHPDPLLSHQNG